jgi:cell division protein FtsB
MRDRTPEKELAPRTRRVVRWLVLLIGVVAWSYALFGSEGLLRQWQALRERNRLAEQLEQERRHNTELEAQIERLRQDELTIERHIRTELDYQRPGETVYLLESGSPDDSRATARNRRFDSPLPAR